MAVFGYKTRLNNIVTNSMLSIVWKLLVIVMLIKQLLINNYYNVYLFKSTQYLEFSYNIILLSTNLNIKKHQSICKNKNMHKFY